MANKPHLLFQNPGQPPTAFRYRTRFPGLDQEEDERDPDYMPLAAEYQRSIRQYNRDVRRRIQERTIEVPAHILYIDIEFFGAFHSKNFENYYRVNFGLSPIKYYQFNSRVIFAITDANLFTNFFEQLNLFIQTHASRSPEYDTKIKFIKSFTLLTTEDLLTEFEQGELVTYLNLVNDVELQEFNVIKESLLNYLQQSGIAYNEHLENRTIEIFELQADQILEVARNFDIIHSINSTSSGIIRPNLVGVAERTFPFTISEPGADYPIVGVIDTGISDRTPLGSILINDDNEYDLTGGNGRVDDVDHGTAVGAFAALGNRLIGEVRGRLSADCRLLSIKVLSAERGIVSTLRIEQLIRKAHRELGVRIFTLTVNFTKHLKTDSLLSNYAYLLDKIAFELDILIFICTSNYRKQNGVVFDINDCNTYPNQFLQEDSNLCPPAESMNNVTVGAIGSNLEQPIFQSITADSYPTIYSRTYHINYERLAQKNNKLHKPDLVYPGGNYTHDGRWPNPEGEAGIQYLSAIPGQFFLRGVGTSYAAPLTANIAIKVLNKYPTLRLQTIKAILINSAKEIAFGPEFTNFTAAQKRFVGGSGVPDELRCLYSNENEVTLVLEDSIRPKHLKSYALAIPTFLNELQKNIGLLEVTATLCFKFQPLLDNQVAYCPVQIAFGIFKNVPLTNADNVLANRDALLIKEGWSQDGYYKSKLYSNVQKIRFTISRQELIDERNEVKIAINSKFHSVLAENVTQQLNSEYEFSLVIRIKEQQPEARQTNLLYDQIQLINSLEVIGRLDVELEGEAEAEV